MKILNKKILNKAATFLLTAVLLCWNALQVEAYTAIDSYPFAFDNIELRLDDSSKSVLGLYKYTGLNDNTYTFNLSEDYSAVHTLYFGNFYYEFMFPYSPDLYDYYIVGTVFGSSELMKDFTFYPDRVLLISRDSSSNYHYFECTDLCVYDFVVADSNGFSFSTKMYLGDNISTFGYLSFIDTDDDNFISGDVKFSASIVPVAKGTEAEQLNQSILNELIKINQNLVTSNSLQQSTIDVINQHDANEKSWFQQLIQSMGIGFSTLYEQMKKEQDDKLYGYQDTTTSEAASAFSSESDKLTALEGDLSTQSNTYVTDYAAEGFDLGVLATIGSSLIFVTTWFTNFWNMGGVFTACLNFCFALSIVFFILRIKR